jgi:signal transduction histidine kinase
MVEVLIDEGPMRDEMLDYSRRILNLSIVISLFTASLVYLSLQWLMVRPMRRITENMALYRAKPEDSTRVIPPSSRTDEIGIAQRELAVMQDELRAALQQKTRLAALGAAVAKVNHDLRNSLATAVLASDKLADIDDPEVKSVMPRLLAAIDRAVGMCAQTLNFVSDAEPQLDISTFKLKDLVAEAGVTVTSYCEEKGAFRWQTDVAADLELEADREQLFRGLINLGQNSFEAGAQNVRISATSKDGWINLDVVDNGPGLAPEAREKLFQPFTGSAKDGGTGLGLVIVLDIARAHGGDVSLIDPPEGGPATGAAFRLKLPDKQ